MFDIIVSAARLEYYSGSRRLGTVRLTAHPPTMQKTPAEFLLDHGLIDAIVPRKNLKQKLVCYLDFLAAGA